MDGQPVACVTSGKTELGVSEIVPRMKRVPITAMARLIFIFARRSAATLPCLADISPFGDRLHLAGGRAQR